jgi:hypothetical protein
MAPGTPIVGTPCPLSLERAFSYHRRLGRWFPRSQRTAAPFTWVMVGSPSAGYGHPATGTPWLGLLSVAAPSAPFTQPPQSGPFPRGECNTRAPPRLRRPVASTPHPAAGDRDLEGRPGRPVHGHRVLTSGRPPNLQPRVILSVRVCGVGHRCLGGAEPVIRKTWPS